MALDGAMLCAVKTELQQTLIESRIDKIYQPSREELVFCMRGRCGVKKLYTSIKVQSARVHITNKNFENPSSPPMFCMLLRKHLVGAKLIDIRQNGWERVLFFDFSTHNELGDSVVLTFALELMGRNSNAILISENGKILDAMKRTDLESSKRPLIPGLMYELPPALENKFDASGIDNLVLSHSGVSVVDELLEKTQGISPLLIREMVFSSTKQLDISCDVLSDKECNGLNAYLKRIQNAANGEGTCPFLLTKNGLPFDYSFLPITQYGLQVVGKQLNSVSELFDEFYAEKDEKERILQQSKDLNKVLQNAKNRISRKIQKQQEELKSAKNRDEKRIYGDLINANISSIEKGASFADVVNYYDEQCSVIRIPLDASKSAAQNAQKYYKEYRKLQNAEEILQQQIQSGEEELIYIESVVDSLSRANSVKDVMEIREELSLSGYVRGKKQKQKIQNALPPIQFTSSNGYTIWVGRNNRQNDLLTLKTAHGRDLWLHTKNIPGSHVIIETKNSEPPEQTILEAAVLAAYHSKSSNSAQVPVDYTLVKYVHKPAGAKPGKVIYEHQQTIYVKPEKTIIDKLKS